MPILLTSIKRRMLQQLSYGYDVGRGFVAGEEEVRKLIDHMSDNRDIAKSLKQMCDNSRLEVIRCLGTCCLVFYISATGSWTTTATDNNATAAATTTIVYTTACTPFFYYYYIPVTSFWPTNSTFVNTTTCAIVNT